MRKRAIWKDFFMEIRTSLSRFLSIFLIVALGVAFFTGIRATNPDMRLTADSYFDDSRLMDIRVVSTMGITEEDVNAIRGLTGVEDAEPIFTTHVVCENDHNEIVIEIMSNTERTNKINVVEGRLPENGQEVLVEQSFLNSAGVNIGDKIKLKSGTDADLSDTLAEEEFTIVGIGTTAYYMSFQRGSTEIGTGEVDSYIVVLPEVFVSEVYSGVNLVVSGAKDLIAFSEGYDEKVDETADLIKGIAKQQCQDRYLGIYKEASAKIEEAKDELNKKREEAKQKSIDAENSLFLLNLNDMELQTAIQNINDEMKKAEEEFQKAENKIKVSEIEISKLEAPVWYVLDRGSIEAYAEYEQNADRIGAIGEVFPAIFFLVAALISLTTMTRMVEEQRTQIGTLKALGYIKTSIAAKYILYALLATLGGSIAGALIGSKVLPMVIITAYKILYRNIPKVIAPFNTYYASLATILAVFCVEAATFLSCFKELAAKPAELMRPTAPKNGKRVVMERIPWIWNRLTFTWKATIRNLIRYKKRFFMTIFGIGGCMALLLVGFGLKDSIFVIYTRQFDEIMPYDATVSIDQEADPIQIAELDHVLKSSATIISFLNVFDHKVDISFHGKVKSINMIVPSDSEKMEDFIVFRDRVGHKPYELSEDGVIITEQIAGSLGMKPGDMITIKKGDETVNAKVAAIVENYMSHYVYMDSGMYQKLFLVEPEYNEYFLLFPDSDSEGELSIGNQLLGLEAASGIFYISYFKNLLDNMLVSLNIVVWVLIIAAGALAFVVLYNLNNININERRRELATIKVLGFYDNELAKYVYRENMILTIFGSLFGILFGIVLHRYVITTVEIEMVMFGRTIDFSSYLYSILLTFLFSAFVNFMMFFKLKKIDMIESLKSVE
ncbi:MAG: hypothetical protein K0S76_1187 [Herbinix sp.]|jgi:putative ABC transport system permease protein|nr:hypothetical protein [Herbinix sp.]